MITHDSNWTVDASREEVWQAINKTVEDRRSTSVANPRVIEHGNVRVEIVAEGDEHGQGLDRRCWYAVPWYVGGRARSWEIISEVRPPEYRRYDVLFCTPPNATAAGWVKLEDLGDGRTRVHFHEQFAMERRWLAPLLERRIHRFISKDNDKNLQGMIENALARQRLAKTQPA